MEGRRAPGGGGQREKKWDNCNSIINKIYFKNLKMFLFCFFVFKNMASIYSKIMVSFLVQIYSKFSIYIQTLRSKVKGCGSLSSPALAIPTLLNSVSFSLIHFPRPSPLHRREETALSNLMASFIPCCTAWCGSSFNSPVSNL